jgi:hypothetical protein
MASDARARTPDVRVRRQPDGRIQVDGPLAGPFDTLEQLAELACDIMTRQPGATNRPYGFEYCALYYHSREASGMSDLSTQSASKFIQSFA